MNVHQKIIRNSAWLYFAELISKLVMFFFILYLARSLGDEQFGIFTFAFSFVFLFTGLITFGMDSLIVRDCSMDKTLIHSYVSNTIIFRIIMSFLVVLMILITSYLLGYPVSTIKILFISSLFLVASSFTQLFTFAIRVYENMRYEAVLKIVEKLVLAVIGTIILFYGFKVWEVSLVYLFSAIIAALLSTYFFIKLSGLKFTVDKLELFKIIKLSLPFIFLVIFYDLYLKVDITILSFLKGDAVTGWYGASSKIIELLMIIPVIFNRALLPTITHIYKETPQQISVLYNFISKYLFTVSLPVFSFSLFMNEKIILLLFGKDFLNASLSLSILTLALIFMYQSFHNHHFLLAIRKEKTAAIIMGSLIGLNVILDFLIIPYLSLNGAALTTLFCNIIFYVVTSIMLRNTIAGINITPFIFKLLFINLLFGILVYYLSNFNLFIVLFSTFLFYGLCLLIFKIITFHEISTVFESIFGKDILKDKVIPSFFK